MRHIVIGIVIGIVVMLCGCSSMKTDSFEYNSPFEDFAKIFKPSEHVGPVKGRYGRATFLAEQGNTSELNRLLKQDRQSSWFDGRRPLGWSSYRGTAPNINDDLVYFYKGKLYCVPPRGSIDHREYLRRIGK